MVSTFVLGGHVSNAAILAGGIVGAGLLISGWLGNDKKKWKEKQAVVEVTPEGIENHMFDTVLNNADRPDTVLQNEDRIRSYIRRMRPMQRELMDGYMSGRLSYAGLMQEIRALSLQINYCFKIPLKFGMKNTQYAPYYRHRPHGGHHVKGYTRIREGLGDPENLKYVGDNALTWIPPSRGYSFSNAVSYFPRPIKDEDIPYPNNA